MSAGGGLCQEERDECGGGGALAGSHSRLRAGRLGRRGLAFPALHSHAAPGAGRRAAQHLTDLHCRKRLLMTATFTGRTDPLSDLNEVHLFSN